MFYNLIKSSIRFLLRNKLFAIVNILGLSIGIACVISILLFLKNELTFDNMHEDRDQIYRVGFHLTMPHGIFKASVITAAVGPSLLDEFPEIESMCRIRNPRAGYFGFDEIQYRTEDVIFADSSFFKMFSFELLSGNKNNILNNPYTIVLSKSLGDKIFDDEDPIGKVINWNNEYDLKVVGVVEDCPQNSSIKYKALISFGTLYERPNMYMGWNGGNSYYNYIKLSEKASIEQLKSKLPDFLEKHINHSYRKSGWLIDLIFDRLDNMHLHSEVTADPSSGDLEKLRNVSLIGVFILLIAIFNFINLSTAQSTQRSVEIGVRKVIGANQSNIAKYFLSESVIISAFAFVIALILIEIFQPQFSLFIENYELYTSSNLFFILFLVLLVLLIGLLAGLYPAFFISRFKPVISLKGSSLGKQKPYLRNALVLLQFIISSVIICYTLILFMQMQYVSNRNLGIDTDRKLIVNLPSKQVKASFKTIKSEFEILSDVKNVSVGSNIVGRYVDQNGYLPEDLENPKLYRFTAFEEDMFEMLDIEFIEGRAFSSDFVKDDSVYIVNEAFVSALAWDKPLEKKIYRNGKWPVIGVVKNFHFENMKEEIKPLIIGNVNTYYFDHLFVELKTGDYQKARDKIELKWKELFPNEPFACQTYNNALKVNYDELKKSIRVMGLFAFMAIVIACLGLYGLAIYTVDRRRKEIGTRKIFGAGNLSVGKLLLIDFIKWIVIANVLSWPFVYYYANKFLQSYAYSMNLDYKPFLISLLVSVFIAILTIFSQLFKLSKTNPIDTIRYE